MEQHLTIERSIIKKYRKQIWNRFIQGIRDYKLINAGDKIAVCISGGKDSMLLAACMQHLQKYSDVPFEAKYLVMNPGYRQKNLDQIVHNAQIMQIPIQIFNSPIFEIVSKSGGSPCYLCARMRRGYLYKEAMQHGCNKIALGHHFNDVVETILMSMLYGSEFKTMMPKLHSTHYAGMELIRPLYMVREADIIAWARYNDLSFIQCACRFTEQNAQAADQIGSSKRQEIKQLIAQLKKSNPDIDLHIFRSTHSVNLATVIGYKWHEKDKIISFLDHYDDEDQRH